MASRAKVWRLGGWKRCTGSIGGLMIEYLSDIIWLLPLVGISFGQQGSSQSSAQESGLPLGVRTQLGAEGINAAFGLAPNDGAYWEKAVWPLTPGAGEGGVMNGMRGFRAARARLRALGDLSDINWTGILQTVPAIESGTAQIVSAANLPGYQTLVQAPAGTVSTPGLSVSSPGSSSWLLLLGVLVIGGGALVLITRR